MPNILIIDDNDDLRFIVQATLSDFGFQVREAREGREGIRLATEQKPDLIVCDVDMPGMDGYQTLAAIREMPLTAAVPFIFLTGSAGKDSFRRAMVSGADDFLTKPFRPQDLIEAVVSRLTRRTEQQREACQQAERLHTEVAQLMSQELSGPIKGILGAATDLMREYATLGPERVFANAYKINESVRRLDRVAKTLVH